MERRSEVLVAYASEYGSTRGVAERIAHRLGAAGCGVDLRAVEEADAAAHDAVVLGSPVYNGAWIPAAADFVRRNAGVLAARPVWLFSVGALGDTHRLVGPLMKREPRDIAEFLEAIAPRDYRVFAGAIEKDRWSSVGRYLFRLFGGRWGDNRDWQQIEAWARDIARALGCAPRAT